MGTQILNTNANVEFDKSKLLEVYAKTEIYDNNDALLDQQLYSHRATANLSELPEYTLNAFISIEDKRFYSHNGLNYGRIAKAIFHNIANPNDLQGGSTISQQLIKNTHLTGEKTLTRKLTEMLLTKKLEAQFSKNDILETYLNVIYFGNNSYGIESASQNFFNKSAKELDIAESAMLAAMIKSPRLYSPLYNPDKCLSRRNLVLNEMLEDKHITNSEYQKAINTELKISNSTLKELEQSNTYAAAALSESADLLNLTERELIMSGIKIYTYLDKNLTEDVRDIVSNPELYPKNEVIDNAVVILDNKTGGVNAFIGKGTQNVSTVKRQPGSAIKPILVYAPAFEYRLITPATPILDEPIDISGYTPQNVKNDFSGWISVRKAIAESKNIPAVKTLSYVGIERAKTFAEKSGICFAPNDNNLALSLGGFTYGVTPLQMANSYMSFANGGNFIPVSFVRKLVDENGKTLYENTKNPIKIMGEDTAYLITDVLKTAVIDGTAKKLNSLNFDVASKTGTVGTDSGNSDAWNLSYTTQHTMCIWYGAPQNTKMPDNCNGGTYPSIMSREIYKKLYSKNTPPAFTVPETVIEQKIDNKELAENQKVLLANDFIPDRYVTTEIFSTKNLPQEISKNFMELNIKNFNVEIVFGLPVITFTPENYVTYEIVRKEGIKETILSVITNTAETVKYTDKTIKPKTYNEYFIKATIKNPKTEQILTEESTSIKIYLENINLNKDENNTQIEKAKNIKDELIKKQTEELKSKMQNKSTKWYFKIVTNII
ncbi:MAG: transglycosylase domain-containing protein [Clostridia bacterium]